MEGLDAIILGAGAAGLAAGRLLRRAGKRALILEARERLGGRMFTFEPRGGEPFPAELGAEYVHGEAPVTSRLARELALTFVEVPDRHFDFDRGRWRQIEDYWGRLGRAFEKIPAGTDRPFADFAKQKLRGRERRRAETFVESFHGAPTSDIGCAGLRATAGEFKAAGRVRRVLGGYAALIGALEREAGEIRRGARALRVASRGRGVEVETPGKIWRAKRALVTLPLGVLQHEPGILGDAFARKRAALQRLAMGAAQRVVFTLARAAEAPAAAFWHDDDAPLFPVWWTPEPRRVVAWSGGPRAEELSRLGEKEAVRRAKARLAALSPGASISSALTHDWRRDEFARGAYSHPRVGGAGASKILERAIGEKIFFAGEAFARDGENATVEGALASGELAAEKILFCC